MNSHLGTKLRITPSYASLGFRLSTVVLLISQVHFQHCQSSYLTHCLLELLIQNVLVRKTIPVSTMLALLASRYELCSAGYECCNIQLRRCCIHIAVNLTCQRNITLSFLWVKLLLPQGVNGVLQAVVPHIHKLLSCAVKEDTKGIYSHEHVLFKPSFLLQQA